MKVREAVDEFISPLARVGGRIYNMGGSSRALLLALALRPFLMVETQEEAAAALYSDILFYRKMLGLPPEGVCLLPASGGAHNAGLRAAAVLRALGNGGSASLVAPWSSFEGEVHRPEVLKALAMGLNVGDELNRETGAERLTALGYVHVPLVIGHGQYSLRGYILDVFPSTSDHPLRVEFFGDEVDSARVFDIDTQRSIREVSGITLLPAAEPEPGQGAAPGLLAEGFDLYCSERAGEEPLDGATVLSPFAITAEGTDAGLLPIAGLGILPDERKDMASLAGAIKSAAASDRVMIVSPSEGQADRLREVFLEEGLDCPLVGAEEAADYAGRVSVSIGGLSAGLRLPGLLILTEHELFSQKPAFRPMMKSHVSRLLASVEDLAEGDFVVHEDRGVGRFRGLVRQKVQGAEYDMVVLEYEGGDRLYLPLHSIDLIHKYHAEDGVVPKLDRLGSASWQKTKSRVRKKIKDMAERLLRIYAEREVSEGFAFSPDTEIHREFDSFFLYEETPDQLKAIEEIKADMESPRPMDRLLCGDVGYGKTEVAMRAAFKAVYDGRQVAVLVPTTLLCEQHARVFGARFSAFPVKVDYISRFKPKKERDRTLKAVQKGEVDIVIATHSILKADVGFRNLGLLIIDEEHRFGVRQKEHIKDLKKGVDVLSMSATPIPRTLQMSLSGIRKMSLIETPPEERLAVKTEVSLYDEGLIGAVIDRELGRKGQAFFLHNRIHDIEKVARRIRAITPLARVAVAHGRMPERKLEDIMLSFINGEVDVLVCTAIVGSGIDIPSANTIIVNLAHMMGLSDLYQLRGRVGRSNIKAYAYYLAPKEGGMTEEAMRRLQAVQELSYMGAGFRLAMKDLEIRGSGNLLGAEQSGSIRAVGFDMYVEMLQSAIAELKGVEVKPKAAPAISVSAEAFIPEDYIEDMTLRLSVYREIAGAETEEELKEVEAEMTDRFGPPPAAFANLLKVMRVRMLAARLGIGEVSQQGGMVRVAFTDSVVAAEDILRVFGPGVRFHESGFHFGAGPGLMDMLIASFEALLEGQEFH